MLMPLMLNLPPDKEAQLRELADAQGQTAEEYTLSLLDEWLAADERDFAEAADAIREGLADLEAGDHGMPLEEYRAEVERSFAHTPLENPT